jgi:hypothetical protein
MNPAIMAAIILCIILPMLLRQKRFKLNITSKRRRKNRMLPKELIQDFIDKVCYISVFDGSFTSMVRLVAFEENWIKVKGPDGIGLINCDMLKEIKLAPEKHQNKYL